MYAYKGRNYGIDANIVGNELEQIRIENNGHLDVADIVTRATDSNNLLHPLFTWDDTHAADLYRRDEARHLIRNIVIVHDGKEQSPAFVNVKVEQVNDAGQQYYQSVRAITENELESAIRECRLRIAATIDTLKKLLRLVPKRQQQKVKLSINDMMTVQKRWQQRQG